ncbi:vWA domain-containing protein [Chelativorans alearense]|uniref:vWA domain-containing protein n=1 Tax=Chelativorans alearense TaxID=2681495 RepID=UPI0013D8246B|nr:VWA domain-containing protein [Chelativorans alearense]
MPARPLPKGAQPFVGFGRLLRGFGHSAAPEQIESFMAAVSLLGPKSMEDIRRAAIATFAPPPERFTEFEALFRGHFYGEAAVTVSDDADEEKTQVKDEGKSCEEHIEIRAHEEGGARSSAAEQLAVRRFARTPDTASGAFGHRLAKALPQRRTFRHLRVRSRGRIDLRRSLREIVRFDGDIPEPILRRRQVMPRRLLVLIDISGSMKLHTEAYLKVAHAAVQGVRAAEVFTFGTRLTRITPALRIRDRDQALTRAAGCVEDWDGGTRIGPTLLAFLSVPRFAAFARGAAVLVLSDGLERGDHAEMAIAMRRLSAKAHRLSLCTPLAGDPHFRPETAGLQAILPALDDLVDGSSTAELTRFMLSLGRPARPAAEIWQRAT